MRIGIMTKIVVSIRNEARSAVYRAALGSNHESVFGFLLGSSKPFESPAIEFSLVSATTTSSRGLWRAPQVFRAQRCAANQVANHTGLEVVGLFGAWDESWRASPNQLFGLWIDIADELGLSYVVHFSTAGGESIWAPRCHAVCHFPSGALRNRTTRGKLSTEPRHNPRRIRAFWNELLLAIKDASAATKFHR
jgi:hypothetical protein